MILEIMLAAAIAVDGIILSQTPNINKAADARKSQVRVSSIVSLTTIYGYICRRIYF